MELRRTWPVALLLITSLSAATSAVFADVATLRASSAPSAQTVSYLVGDIVLAVASALALIATLARRSWAAAALRAWMVALLLVVGWILFVALGAEGPSTAVRIAVWLSCALLSAMCVWWVARLSAKWRTDAPA